MDAFRLSRELGDPYASRLQLEYTTRQFHSLQRASGVTFVRSQPKGINTLAIERQESRLLLSGGSSGTVSVFDLSPPLRSSNNATATSSSAAAEETYELVPTLTLQAHKFGVSSITWYSQDNGLFVTSSYDTTLKVWDAQEMTPVATFEMESIIHNTAMSPGGSHALVATALGEGSGAFVRLVDLDSGASTHTLVGHKGEGVLGVDWSPRNEYLLASGGTDGGVRLWDVRQTGSCLACLDMEGRKGGDRMDVRNLAHRGAVSGVRWCEGGERLVTVGQDDKMRVWDMATGGNSVINLGSYIHTTRTKITNPVIIPLRQSDPQLIFTTRRSDILGFNLDNGKLVEKFQETESTITALVQRPHFAELYSSSVDGNITTWRPKLPEDDGDDDDYGDEDSDKKQSVLNSIYRSLIQTPLTFT